MARAAQDVFVPLLTEADPAVSAEGTLDPLGLYAIADSLGVTLVPGVRERQSHPRYLTAMAVGAAVCSEFDEDTVADDGVSPPSQVYEWYMVEGLMRTQSSDGEIYGLPGRDKVGRALREQLPVSAKTYLKTPSVFGFHGVYRLLARTLDVVDDHGLGETGYRLLSEWEQEQGIQGFHTDEAGPGRYYRRTLTDAVRAGLEKGATTRSGGWDGWKFFRDHLIPSEFGKREQALIVDALLASESPLRKELTLFLVSQEGQACWRTSESEKEFHALFHSAASPDLAVLLDAIKVYEKFSRLLQDAFDDCLLLMTRKAGKTLPSELTQSPCVSTAAREMSTMFATVSDLLQPFGESVRFEENFADFAYKEDSVHWVSTLLEHHCRTQANKPPNGKAPWFERFDDGSAVVRPGYRREKGGKGDRSYLHAYRTTPLWSFACDLGLVEA